MRATLCATLALLAAGLSSGCVTRRMLITSDPPGAQVYVDGQPIGATPVERPFIYYGKYRYRLVKDGYQPLDVEPELSAPFYQWTGIDFVTENLIPFTFRDTQALHFQLVPLEAVRHEDVRARAEELRGQGKTIGPPPGVQPRNSNKSKESPKQLPEPTPVEQGPPLQPSANTNETAGNQAAGTRVTTPVSNAQGQNTPPVKKQSKGFATSPTAPATPSPSGGQSPGG